MDVGTGIDSLVCTLYGLTKEEIAIVESSQAKYILPRVYCLSLAMSKWKFRISLG